MVAQGVVVEEIQELLASGSGITRIVAKGEGMGTGCQHLLDQVHVWREKLQFLIHQRARIDELE